MRFRNLIGLITLFCFVAIVLALHVPKRAHGGASPPGDWQQILVSNGTLDTFPATYTLRTGRSEVVPYQIKYTYGGTGTITVTEECSIDGINFIVLDTPIAAASTSQSIIDVLSWTDAVGVEHANVLCMVSRIVFTAAGGTPTLSGVYISYIRKN